MTEIEKLQWVRNCVDNYLSEKTINNINPVYYKEWMLNLRKKILDKIDEFLEDSEDENTEHIQM